MKKRLSEIPQIKFQLNNNNLVSVHCGRVSVSLITPALNLESNSEIENVLNFDVGLEQNNCFTSQEEGKNINHTKRVCLCFFGLPQSSDGWSHGSSSGGGIIPGSSSNSDTTILVMTEPDSNSLQKYASISVLIKIVKKKMCN